MENVKMHYLEGSFTSEQFGKYIFPDAVAVVGTHSSTTQLTYSRVNNVVKNIESNINTTITLLIYPDIDSLLLEQSQPIGTVYEVVNTDLTDDVLTLLNTVLTKNEKVKNMVIKEIEL